MIFIAKHNISVIEISKSITYQWLTMDINTKETNFFFLFFTNYKMFLTDDLLNLKQWLTSEVFCLNNIANFIILAVHDFLPNQTISG